MQPEAVVFDTIAIRRGWRAHPFETWQGRAWRLVAKGLFANNEAEL